MKRLITLISTESKTPEESTKVFMANFIKYKKVTKQVEKELVSKE